jgi:hypothetical protein
MRRIYYSHSMRSYNTDQERLELTKIASFFPSVRCVTRRLPQRKVINPNGAITPLEIPTVPRYKTWTVLNTKLNTVKFCNGVY